MTPPISEPLTRDPMEATCIGSNMWKQAVEKAKSTDIDKVIAAMAGPTFSAPYIEGNASNPDKPVKKYPGARLHPALAQRGDGVRQLVSI